MADPLTEVLDRRAAFAQTFKDTTNLSQRRRYAQDIGAASENRDELNERDFNIRLQNDPDFARTVTARDRLQLDRESRLRDDQLAESRFNFDIEKTNRMEKLAREKFELDLSREKRQLEKDEEGLQEARRITADTEFLEKAERDLRVGRGLFPGDPEYSKSAMELLIRHPYAAPALRKSLVDAMRVDMDPDDFVFELKEIRDSGMEPRITVTTDAFGNKKRTLTSVPKKDAKADTEKEYGNVLKEWQEAVALRSRMTDSEGKPVSGFSDEDRLLADEIKTRAAQKLATLRSQSVSGGGNGNQAGQPAAGATAPATPVPTAAPAQPADKPAVVRQNGIEYRLQPDGSYK